MTVEGGTGWSDVIMTAEDARVMSQRELQTDQYGVMLLMTTEWIDFVMTSEESGVMSIMTASCTSCGGHV